MRWINTALRLLSSRRRQAHRDAHRLYAAAVERARAPEFYELLGVPDTIDGRFDLITVHVALLCRRLGQDGASAPIAQALFDAMFADMEQNLRELGVSDTVVGARVKKMAAGFYGRASAYERGLTGSEDLEEALRRNLYGTVAPDAAHVARMAGYLRHAAADLADMTATAVEAGEGLFPPILRNEPAAS